MNMQKNKRRVLDLATKVKIIKEVENNKKGVVAKKMGIPPSTLSTILSQKEKIREEWTKSGCSSQRKKIRPIEYADVDQALLQWFTQQRTYNVPINGPILQEKAKQFAEELGHRDFKGSTGFINSFKVRYGITFRSVCGESSSSNIKEADEWVNNILLPLLISYNDNDIYNADESSLFYECLPSYTMAFKGDKCSGGKRSKCRLTILFCCNMSGSDKRKLLLIGKSSKPRCFKNIDVNKFPVQYVSNRKAWMTGDIWNQWLSAFDNSMIKEKRKVLIVVDNVSSHHRFSLSALQAVKVLFLPPNMTSLIQPCDQGIIRSFKTHYRTMLLQRLILHIESQKEIPKFQFNILDAISVCNHAWNQVSAETIQHCFRHAGFVRHDSIELSIQTECNINEKYRNIFSYIQSKYVTQMNISAEDFLTIDNQVAVEETMTDEEIILTVRKEHASLTDSDQEEIEIVPEDPISLSNAIQCISILRTFCNQKGLQTWTLGVIEQEIASSITSNLSQSLITKFFKKH